MEFFIIITKLFSRNQIIEQFEIRLKYILRNITIDRRIFNLLLYIPLKYQTLIAESLNNV